MYGETSKISSGSDSGGGSSSSSSMILLLTNRSVGTVLDPVALACGLAVIHRSTDNL